MVTFDDLSESLQVEMYEAAIYVSNGTDINIFSKEYHHLIQERVPLANEAKNNLEILNEDFSRLGAFTLYEMVYKEMKEIELRKPL